MVQHGAKSRVCYHWNLTQLYCSNEFDTISEWSETVLNQFYQTEWAELGSQSLYRDLQNEVINTAVAAETVAAET